MAVVPRPTPQFSSPPVSFGVSPPQSASIAQRPVPGVMEPSSNHHRRRTRSLDDLHPLSTRRAGMAESLNPRHEEPSSLERAFGNSQARSFDQREADGIYVVEADHPDFTGVNGTKEVYEHVDDTESKMHLEVRQNEKKHAPISEGRALMPPRTLATESASIWNYVGSPNGPHSSQIVKSIVLVSKVCLSFSDVHSGAYDVSHLRSCRFYISLLLQPRISFCDLQRSCQQC